MKKRLLIVIALVLSASFVSTSRTKDPVSPRNVKALESAYGNKDCHFIVLNDAGQNGYKNQKAVAEAMGVAAKIAKAQFVVSAGDQLHMNGAQSASDPIWTSNFEIIYTSQSLLWIPWYVISGNHEYHSSVDALIDYSSVSPRWNMPSRYYSIVKTDPKSGASLRIIMLDTTPMQAAPNDTRHSDALQQDVDAQVEWLRRTLDDSPATDWTILVGHHPVYANTAKPIREQEYMQERLLPILSEHPEISYYICGHIHIFEHIVKPGLPDFIVNASAGTGRDICPGEAEFSYGDSGFMMMSFNKEHLNADLIDKNGKIVYSIQKNK